MKMRGEPAVALNDEQLDHLEGLAIRERDETLHTVVRVALQRDWVPWSAAEVALARKLCTRLWNQRLERGALGDHP